MARPSSLPVWATVPADPGDIVTPSVGKQALGWTKIGGIPEKPAYEYFNWLQNLTYQWLNYWADLTDTEFTQLKNINTAAFSVAGWQQLERVGNFSVADAEKAIMLDASGNVIASNTFTSSKTFQLGLAVTGGVAGAGKIWYGSSAIQFGNNVASISDVGLLSTVDLDITGGDLSFTTNTGTAGADKIARTVAGTLNINNSALITTASDVTSKKLLVPSIQPDTAAAFNFFLNNGTTNVGNYSTAGLWTVGPTSGNVAHQTIGKEAAVGTDGGEIIRFQARNTSTTTSKAALLIGGYSTGAGTAYAWIGTYENGNAAGAGLKFASYTTEVGGYSAAGAWSWGPTTGANHTAYVTDRITLQTPNTTASCMIVTNHNGTNKGFIGTQGTTDASIIAGYTADYGLALAGTGGIGFSGNGGGTLHGEINTAGYHSIGDGSPLFKVKKLEGNLANAGSLSTSIAHGLTKARIKTVTGKYLGGSGYSRIIGVIATGGSVSTASVDCYWDDTNVYLDKQTTNVTESNGAAYVLYVTYEAS